MRLRQVVIAAETLEEPRATLFDLFGLEADYPDPGVGFFGLKNSVMALGDSFFEIVVPIKEGTTAGRLLDRRQTTCGYMVLFQVESHAETMARMERLGVRSVWSHEDEKVAASHVHPKDVGGAIVSFDEMRPASEWVWGGPDWQQQRASDVTRVLGCTMQSPDVDALARRWATVLDRPARDDGGAVRIDLDAGTFVSFVPFVPFVDGEAYEGVRGYTIGATDPDAIGERAERLGLGGATARLGEVELSFVADG